MAKRLEDLEIPTDPDQDSGRWALDWTKHVVER